MSGTVDDAVGEVLENEAEADEDSEGGPAMDFGLKVGIALAAVAAYVLLASPYRVLALSSARNELFADVDTGAEPFFYVAVATLVVSFLTGVAYAQGRERYDGYRMDLAIGVVVAPIAVLLLVFGAIVFEPMFVDLLAGNVADAVFFFVVAAIVVTVLALSRIGLIFAVVVFGVYLVLPSVVGSYAGAFLGGLVRTDAG